MSLLTCQLPPVDHSDILHVQFYRVNYPTFVQIPIVFVSSSQILISLATLNESRTQATPLPLHGRNGAHGTSTLALGAATHRLKGMGGVKSWRSARQSDPSSDSRMSACTISVVWKRSCSLEIQKAQVHVSRMDSREESFYV